MPTVKNKPVGYSLIFASTLLVLFGVLTQSPIAQDLNYHMFEDTRMFYHIPNFWNVTSNIPFLIVGLMGLYKIVVTRKLTISDETKLAYMLIFLGTSLVSLGSGYYHWQPDNDSLIWDRLPMSIAFMALMMIIVSEFISARVGKLLLLPSILTGVVSVIYWYYSEIFGQGDLRFYIIVQFLPLVVIPIILSFFHSRFTRVHTYWWLLAAYVSAKLCELFDAEIYNALGFISGHSIKHIVVALGIYVVLVTYEKRGLSKAPTAGEND